MLPTNILSDLYWLPAPPADFKARKKQLALMECPYNDLIALANFRLNPTQTSSLGKLIDKYNDLDRSIGTNSRLSLGIVSNATTEIISPYLPTTSLRHGVQLSVIQAPYNQILQTTMDPESMLHTSNLDAVLMAVDYHWLSAFYHEQSSDLGFALATEQIDSIIECLNGISNTSVILQTIPTPPTTLFGSLDRLQSSSLRNRINSYNTFIAEIVESTDNYLFDVAALAERVGTEYWFDPVQWHAYKLPFSSEFGLLYADRLASLFGSIRGKSKKCLVLDLDNTIWGGVIGDDGLDGIILGQGSALGEAFLSVQTLALELKSRGVILAVCSKNNDETARAVFRNHPDMLLKEKDIAVFQANWVDKASNLEVIASSLNIGLDSLVLLDDNPAERAQVRAALPMVGVPELPNDPALYTRYLTSAGYFEATSFSRDDELRAASYTSNAKRKQVQAKSRNIEDYLQSLNMEMQISSFDTNEIERITQLINKTNQFNLTTKRITSSQARSIISDASYFTMQVRLKDSFGEFGMIALAVLSREQKTWTIDQWLMSCRVLGRKIEDAMLQFIVTEAQKSGIERLIGLYIPTQKNNMVKDHYTKLGFTPTASETKDLQVFSLNVSEYVPKELPIVLSDSKKADV